MVVRDSFMLHLPFVFQSHAGSIEAESRLSHGRIQPIEFQSHAGSIEAWFCPDAIGSPVLGFNPTLVRLRPLSLVKPLGDLALFQSHAGSIEAQSQVPNA